jgi:hypothetical protein
MTGNAEIVRAISSGQSFLQVGHDSFKSSHACGVGVNVDNITVRICNDT